MRNRNIFKNISNMAYAIIKRKPLPEKTLFANPFRTDLTTIDKIKSISQFWNSG